jgi:hypothetical protein
MKINMRLTLAYKKPGPHFDGKLDYEIKQGHLANNIIHITTKANYKLYQNN